MLFEMVRIQPFPPRLLYKCLDKKKSSFERSGECECVSVNVAVEIGN